MSKAGELQYSRFGMTTTGRDFDSLINNLNFE